jgi:subtilisin family serine protease
MGRSRAVLVRRLAAAGFATAAAVGLAIATTVPASAAPDVQILGADTPTAIDNSYIVVYKDGAAAEAKSTAASLGSKVTNSYDAVFSGFAASIDEEQAKKLGADPDVAFVQQNQVVSITADQPSPPSWGLDRIDQRNLPVNNNYSYTATGAGVHAYIIDTGLDLDHPDFSGRATSGFDVINGGAADDGNGHGTHVAGTVGGELHGVAKDVSLVAVRVLDNSGGGTSAGVISGVNWVTNNAIKPAVANMSLGTNVVDNAINTAVRNSIASGVTYAIASGNSTANACGFSPASVAEAITVNASTASDARASFSNFGNCTNIFAPGNGITSAWLNGGTNTISGTSMAAPHVAGAAALYLEANPTAAPAAVGSALVAASTSDKITSAGTGSPNKLLYTGTGAAEPPPTNGPCAAATNATNYTISDNSTVNSPLAITGCTGTASNASTVTVGIVHTYIQDLVVSLVAPDGSVYTLHNKAGGSADNINATYTLNLTSETAAGTWNLRVQDTASIDTGYIDTWTLDL